MIFCSFLPDTWGWDGPALTAPLSPRGPCVIPGFKESASAGHLLATYRALKEPTLVV